MKVLDLRCANGHAFEGWFGSEDEFLQQNGEGGVECPLCGVRVISRLPSAPRLNLSGARSSTTAESPARAADRDSEPAVALQAAWLTAARRVLANTEDVGERFVDEARRIHYGDAEPRSIRGQASPEQREELREEGIEVMPLPLPEGFDGPVQ